MLDSGKLTDKQKQIALNKYQVIMRYRNNELSRKEAAGLLKFKQHNYINELLRKLDTNNEYCFIHSGLGMEKKKKYNEEFIANITRIYKEIAKVIADNSTEQTSDISLNFSHFKNLLKRNYNIDISYSTLKVILNEAQIYSPKAKPRDTTSVIVGCRGSQPKRESGQEVQIDGTMKIRFADENRECCCVLAVDVGSNVLVGAHFDFEETNYAHEKCLDMVLNKHGKFIMARSDNRTTYSNGRNDTIRDTLVSNALKDLGIIVETTSNPLDKHHIENKHVVLKDRILKELKLAGVRTIEHANRVISETLDIVNADLGNFIPKENAFIKLDNPLEFINLLNRFEQRSIDDHNCIVYKKNYYYPVINDSVKCIRNKTKVELVIAQDNKLSINYQGNNYKLVHATPEARRKLRTNNIKKTKKDIVSTRFDFRFAKKWYQIIDVTGESIEIEAFTQLHIYYDSIDRFTPIYVVYKNRQYDVLNGKYEAPNDEIEISCVSRKIKFDSTFKDCGKNYILTKNNLQVVLKKGTTISCIRENGSVSYAKYDNEIYHIRDIAISSVGVFIPKSNFQASSFWKEKNVLII